MKSIICVLIIALVLVIIDASYIKKRNTMRFKTEGENGEVSGDKKENATEAIDELEYVVSCYRQGNDCCDEFKEQCHDNNDCKEDEICCLANCTIQCYPIDKLGVTPEKALEDEDEDEHRIREKDPDYIRFPTNAKPNTKANRTECYKRSEGCCMNYIEECHDNSDCEENETCCEEDCGSTCYLTEKLGQKILDGKSRLEEEEDVDDTPVRITASKTLDGTLTIVVKPVKDDL